MSDWQPISTAPKNGTDILVAAHDEDGSEWFAVAQWWVAEFVFLYSLASQVGEPVRLCFKPTHWMPLPKAPASASTASGFGAVFRDENTK